MVYLPESGHGSQTQSQNDGSAIGITTTVHASEMLRAVIDMQSVRLFRAILDGSATDFDKNKLKESESQGATLRQALSEFS